MGKLRKSKKGFTLVELIVVVTVLGILAAIAIPVAGSIIEKANTNADAANVALYQGAIEKSVADGFDYPQRKPDVEAAITSYTAITVPIPAPKAGGYFIYNPQTNKVATTPGAIWPAPWFQFSK